MITKMYEKLNTINILIMFVDKCNFSCEYCYNDIPRTNKQLNIYTLLCFLKHLKKQTTKQIIVQLIGGEPTLHPDLYEFCKQCIYENIKIQIYTNFSINQQLYKQLLYIGVELIISWHYQYKKESFLKNIYNLYNDLKILNNYNIIIMLDPIWFDTGQSIFEILISYNTKNIIPMLLDYNKHTRQVFYYSNNITYSISQIQKYYDMITKCNLTKYFTAIQDDNKEIKLSILDVTENDKYQKFKYWKCNAGMEYLYIDQYGDVYTCITTKKDTDKNILININNYSQFKLLNKPIICKRNICYCMWEVYKERIINYN